MTSMNLAVLALSNGFSAKHIVPGPGHSWPVRDHCTFAIAGIICVEVEL